MFPFSDSTLSSRPVLRLSNGFYYCKHDKKRTHYVTKIIIEQKNNKGVADGKFIFLNT